MISNSFLENPDVKAQLSDNALSAAAHELVGADGFGFLWKCNGISAHYITLLAHLTYCLKAVKIIWMLWILAPTMKMEP
jgi:hypothetical protein